ncbi:ABC transporter ATP-binding protein [Alicyclobacillaceae bacterium I2511]|nr:ABC transporter ATP-binding protein [Alicyclobacillaceae bacterium I2511]
MGGGKLEQSFLTFNQVSKQYRTGQWANRGITLSFPAGQIVGILGPNGAGKTTLLRMLVGLLKPTAGDIRLSDRVIHPGQRWVQEMITYLPQHPLALSDLKVEEAIRYSALLRGVQPEVARERTEELLRDFDLSSMRSRLVSQLSGGESRLVSVASVLVAPTPVVALDEPTNELDPLMRKQVWERIGNLRSENRLVLLVSHNVLEAETVLDYVVILAEGQVVRSGSPQTIRDEVGRFTTIVLSVKAHVQEWVAKVAGVVGERPEVDGAVLTLHVAQSEAVQRLTTILRGGLAEEIESIQVSEPSLEEMYLRIRDQLHTPDLQRGAN